MTCPHKCVNNNFPKKGTSLTDSISLYALLRAFNFFNPRGGGDVYHQDPAPDGIPFFS